ncbi:MAG: Z1 domain-containing protein [Bryobacteraceae bacterium]|nr:Z1 domain-containing protein [Bryobacteraceae bacterium]
MPDLEKLIYHVSDALEKREEPPAEPELLNLIQAHAGVLALTEGEPYTPAQIDEAMRRLQTQFITRMGLGTLFEAEDYRPWLAGAQGDIDPYYWTRYRSHLRREGLSKQVVGTLDAVTDEILDHLENPKKEGRWARKGLVVGHVQSGKTANYTGLVAKAADAGYKVIIVLAGMLNSLRNQTQERIDADFMGWCTIRNRPIGAARFGAERRPVCFTTAREDFKKHTATSIAMQLGALREPVLLVLKKNPSTLENLHEWLSGNNRHNLKDFPMLLIDDEADHASINTNKPEADPTTINRWIRDVLALFPRCSFVGYTATPFANIFIDPETEDEMTSGELYRDLFPRDFIYSLDPPTNYVGASALFLDEGNLDCIREIDDHEDLLPTGHKITFIPQALPDSLTKAIGAFIIGKAIRLLRKQAGQHHSMMINVSRFTGVQNYLKDLVLEEVKRSRQAIGNYAGLASEAALQNSVLRILHDTWAEEYHDAGFGWPEVQSRLKEAIDPVEVISVNTRGSGILDYSKENYPNGRTIIAVGGLSLSRGLTLHGLMSSYFLRNSIMYDTLMQMGRWFGYRDGYADLCRIHMTPQAASWYAHIAEAIEELRADFKDMKAARMTPLEFGLRVRSHPTALIVTARNKMRASREIPVSIALEGRLAETSVLLGHPDALTENKRVLESLVRAASAEKSPEPHVLGWLWKSVSSVLAKAVVTGFQNHPECILTYREPLLEYIEWLEGNGQRTFDVLLRSAGEGNFMVGSLQIDPIIRTVSNATPARIEFSKRRVASRGDERAGLSKDEIAAIKQAYTAANPDKDVPDKEYRKFRQSAGRPPLLMVMFAGIRPKDDQPVTAVVPAYGIGFPGDPGSQRRAKKLVQYRVNTVWWQKNVLTPEDEEDPE